MKILQICLTAMLILLQIAGLAQQKKAFLIGIGTYPAGSGWKNLSSDNDMVYLRQALELYGFAGQQVTLIQNEAATYKGIQQAMAAFVAGVKPGDVIWLHFSGHGQQITDDNGDEADGYDESWVCYDAASSFNNVTYRGNNHLRDDEVDRWIREMTAKAGPTGSILVTIDACHSGTATRSQRLGAARGVPTPFKIPKSGQGTLRNNFGQSGEFLEQPAHKTANVVVISASAPTQINYETTDDNQQGVGALSFALAKSLTRLPQDCTYYDLYIRTKAMLQAENPGQLPHLEGNAAQKLFSGRFAQAATTRYIDRWTSDTTFLITQGSLHGLMPGTEITLLNSQKRPIAVAVVHKCALAESEAVVQLALDKKEPYSYEIAAQPAAAYQLNVWIDKEELPDALYRQLQQYLKGLAFVKLSVHADAFVSYAADSGIILTGKEAVARQHRMLKPRQPLQAEDLTWLKTTLQALARAAYMRRLPEGGPLEGGVVWRITNQAGHNASDSNLVLKKGDTFTMMLHNKTKKPLYFALVNLLPDGRVQILLPTEGSFAEDFSLQPGERYEITDNKVEEDLPAGTEYLKILVSHTPFDIRPAFVPGTTRSTKPASWELALQEIMEAQPEEKRQTRSAEVNEITLLTQSFRIAEN